jgi:hypothetical protein
MDEGVTERVSYSILLHVLIWTVVTAMCAGVVTPGPQVCRAADAPVAAASNMSASIPAVPLSFIRNEGQRDEEILFYAQGNGLATAFTKEGISISLGRSGRMRDQTSPETLIIAPLDASMTTVEGVDKKEGKVNYLVGKDPKKWKTDISTYGAVLYRNLYPGIDMKVYGTNSQLEYDLIVSPGRDPSKIRLSCRGIQGLSLTAFGELEVILRDGSIVQKKPRIYQAIEGETREILGTFVLVDETTYGFEVASYDMSRPLVIDPELIYSTYLGGSKDDRIYAMAVDSSGSVYVTGWTISDDFPLKNPFQSSCKGNCLGRNVFVTKLSAPGNALVYSTYLGGSDDDLPSSIAVDSSGSAYVTGWTISNDFPTKNAFQAACAGGCHFRDAFITKLSPAGNSLVYSTYLGGASGDDEVYSIALDSSKSAYVTGHTKSNDYPMKNPAQAACTGECWWGEAFVTKLSPPGNSLVYSTYLGGSGDDLATAIAVSPSGNAYVAGYTKSVDFPTRNPFQPSCTGYCWWGDAFVTKLSPAGNSLVYSTYLGGSVADAASAVAVDASGNAYVGGYTKSTDFPVKNPVQASCGGDCLAGDAFITKLSPPGNSLIYSTYLGGSYSDSAAAVALDSAGNAYVAGQTSSIDFPVSDAYQPANRGLIDAFITKLSPPGNSLVHSTYLGGSGDDVASAFAVDPMGNSYGAGWTTSTDFPTKDPYQGSNAGYSDSFIVKFGPDLTTLIVAKSGTGIGTVTSAPSGIACGNSCSSDYLMNTVVSLTAEAGLGSAFSGWSGDCKGTGVCKLVMTGNKSAVAAFQPATCAYALSPAKKTFLYNGGKVLVNISTKGGANCPVPAISKDADWITLSPITFNKNKGTVTIIVSENGGISDRNGTVTIGGTPFLVFQKVRACTITLSSPVSGLFPKAGGTGSFDVNGAPANCAWTASPVASSSWVHITSGASGSGSGTVAYAVDANAGKAARNGRINVTLTASKKSKPYGVRQGNK